MIATTRYSPRFFATVVSTYEHRRLRIPKFRLPSSHQLAEPENAFDRALCFVGFSATNNGDLKAVCAGHQCIYRSHARNSPGRRHRFVETGTLGQVSPGASIHAKNSEDHSDGEIVAQLARVGCSSRVCGTSFYCACVMEHDPSDLVNLLDQLHCYFCLHCRQVR
jgi:hypothetical protein